MKTYEIFVSNENVEAEGFAGWLIGKGHRARVSQTTHNFVDGEDCATNSKAAQIKAKFWIKYCSEKMS